MRNARQLFCRVFLIIHALLPRSFGRYTGLHHHITLPPTSVHVSGNEKYSAIYVLLSIWPLPDNKCVWYGSGYGSSYSGARLLCLRCLIPLSRLFEMEIRCKNTRLYPHFCTYRPTSTCCSSSRWAKASNLRLQP